MRDFGMLDLVTLGCALGCGLIGGLLFAFSIAVMRALGTLPPAQGVAAMQAINVVIINPWFMTPFLGTAVASVFVAIAAWWQGPAYELRRPYLVAGGLLYVLGVFLVTMVFNVPRNDALAAVAASSPEAERLWVSYLSSWTAWNHVRTLAALAAATCFIIAFRLRS